MYRISVAREHGCVYNFLYVEKIRQKAEDSTIDQHRTRDYFW